MSFGVVSRQGRAGPFPREAQRPAVLLERCGLPGLQHPAHARGAPRLWNQLTRSSPPLPEDK